MTKRLDKYIEIVEVPHEGKTKKWNILSVGNIVGQIAWYGGWRKYVYFDLQDASRSDADYMRLIADFLDKVNEEHFTL